LNNLQESLFGDNTNQDTFVTWTSIKAIEIGGGMHIKVSNVLSTE